MAKEAEKRALAEATAAAKERGEEQVEKPRKPKIEDTEEYKKAMHLLDGLRTYIVNMDVTKRKAVAIAISKYVKGLGETTTE
jgi:hypothetical protein